MDCRRVTSAIVGTGCAGSLSGFEIEHLPADHPDRPRSHRQRMDEPGANGRILVASRVAGKLER